MNVLLDHSGLVYLVSLPNELEQLLPDEVPNMLVLPKPQQARGALHILLNSEFIFESTLLVVYLVDSHEILLDRYQLLPTNSV